MSENSIAQADVTEQDQTVRASYAAVAAELHRIADIVGDLPATGPAALQANLTFSFGKHGEDKATESARAAAVDALASALLGSAGKPEELSIGNWQHRLSNYRGPVWVSAYTRIENPAARGKDAELEQLRAELAEANRKLAATEDALYGVDLDADEHVPAGA